MIPRLGSACNAHDAIRSRPIGAARVARRVAHVDARVVAGRVAGPGRQRARLRGARHQRAQRGPGGHGVGVRVGAGRRRRAVRD